MNIVRCSVRWRYVMLCVEVGQQAEVQLLVRRTASSGGMRQICRRVERSVLCCVSLLSSFTPPLEAALHWHCLYRLLIVIHAFIQRCEQQMCAYRCMTSGTMVAHSAQTEAVTTTLQQTVWISSRGLFQSYRDCDTSLTSIVLHLLSTVAAHTQLIQSARQSTQQHCNTCQLHW